MQLRGYSKRQILKEREEEREAIKNWNQEMNSF
jgi:hypothetical protein